MLYPRARRLANKDRKEANILCNRDLESPGQNTGMVWAQIDPSKRNALAVSDEIVMNMYGSATQYPSLVHCGMSDISEIAELDKC
ncbi:MAG: hypothetical protein ACRD39_05160 [Nitrososphaeraceae archaeon]